MRFSSGKKEDARLRGHLLVFQKTANAIFIPLAETHKESYFFLATFFLALALVFAFALAFFLALAIVFLQLRVSPRVSIYTRLQKTSKGSSRSRRGGHPSHCSQFDNDITNFQCAASIGVIERRLPRFKINMSRSCFDS